MSKPEEDKMRYSSQKQTPQTPSVARSRACCDHRGNGRGRLIVTALLCCSMGLALTAGPSGASGSVSVARVARALTATETAHLHMVPNSGEEILEVGRVTGTLPGTVRAYLNVGPTVTARFTIHTTAGSISGIGSGKLKGRAAEPSFSGRMTVRHGTGRYVRAHGEGGFYGTLNRRTYALVVQTTGTLSY